jgi:hypothetical protein
MAVKLLAGAQHKFILRGQCLFITLPLYASMQRLTDRLEESEPGVLFNVMLDERGQVERIPDHLLTEGDRVWFC